MFLFQIQPLIRPVRCSDAEAMARFVDGLSPHDRRQRFHAGVSRCSKAMAQALTAADTELRRTWVACFDGVAGETIVAEARWALADEFGLRAEIAITVDQAWQGRGLADRLMTRLVASALREGISCLDVEVLSDNTRMLAFARRHGFAAEPADDLGEAVVRLVRRPGQAAGWTPSLWQRLRAAVPQGLSPASSRSTAASSSLSPRSSKAWTSAAPSESVAVNRH